MCDTCEDCVQPKSRSRHKSESKKYSRCKTNRSEILQQRNATIWTMVQFSRLWVWMQEQRPRKVKYSRARSKLKVNRPSFHSRESCEPNKPSMINDQRLNFRFKFKLMTWIRFLTVRHTPSKRWLIRCDFEANIKTSDQEAQKQHTVHKKPERKIRLYPANPHCQAEYSGKAKSVVVL